MENWSSEGVDGQELIKIEVKTEIIEDEELQSEPPSDIVADHLQTSTALLHEILHRDNRPTQSELGQGCQYCGKIYKTKTSLQFHYTLKHPDRKVNAQCEKCNKQYSSLIGLKKHVYYKHRYEHRCKVCYKSFMSSVILDNHVKSCKYIEMPCIVCGKVFTSHIAHRNHMNYKHPASRSHWCEKCRRSYRSARGLSNHIASIHSPGATTCYHCDTHFNSIPALQSHIAHKHREIGGIKGIRLSDPTIWSSNKEESTDNKSDEEPKFPRCEVCSATLTTSEELIKHIIAKHVQKPMTN